MSLKNQLSGAIISGNNQKVSDVVGQMTIDEVNEKNIFGDTILHKACSSKRTVSSKNNQALSILLAKPGIDVNAKNIYGSTPLHEACFHDHHRVVDKLLGCPDIDENAQNNQGCTPIMIAAKMCSKELLRVMLKSARVDLDVKDKEGRGLEECVGMMEGESNEGKKCLDMIREERVKRRNMLENEKSGEETVVGIGIENIETINKKIEDGEQRWKGNLDNRKLKRKELDERQSSELERLAKKHRNEKLAMEERLHREKSALEDTLDKEKIALQETFDKEDEDNEWYMTSLKEIRKNLTQNIENSTNDLSKNERGKLEAARQTLECPVCMETMKPPTRIWMCRLSHAMCETCKDRMKGGPHPLCPTCKSERVNQRAIIAEKFAESVFNK